MYSRTRMFKLRKKLQTTQHYKALCKEPYPSRYFSKCETLVVPSFKTYCKKLRKNKTLISVWGYIPYFQEYRKSTPETTEVCCPLLNHLLFLLRKSHLLIK